MSDQTRTFTDDEKAELEIFKDYLSVVDTDTWDRLEEGEVPHHFDLQDNATYLVLDFRPRIVWITDDGRGRWLVRLDTYTSPPTTTVKTGLLYTVINHFMTMQIKWDKMKDEAPASYAAQWLEEHTKFAQDIEKA